jgi:antitoxin component YwqK of YwqJK toxin-antitoxin module
LQFNNSMRLLLAFVSLIILMISCASRETATTSAEEDGLKKYFYADGKTLYMEVPYENGVPHGSSKQYFKDGQLFEQMTYVKGVKHGLTLKYYEDGKLSQETPYDSGRVHGIQKKYRKDGGLAYEAPYHYDKPCVGLKEYYTSGREVNKYPAIVIREENRILNDNRFSLHISLSENITRVEFFKGKLTNEKYVGNEVESIWAEKPGVARLDYFLPPGSFVMEEINIIARYKTELGNYKILQKKYNLAQENRY